MTQSDMPDEIWIDGTRVHKSPTSVYSCNIDGSDVVLAKDSPYCTRYVRALPPDEVAKIASAIMAGHHTINGFVHRSADADEIIVNAAKQLLGMVER